jgi:hypothetical protein
MEKKHVSYYYDGELREEDTVIDGEGTAPVPEKGAIIRMHGQNWRVTHVGMKAGGEDEFVLYKIYLARA